MSRRDADCSSSPSSFESKSMSNHRNDGPKRGADYFSSSSESSGGPSSTRNAARKKSSHESGAARLASKDKENRDPRAAERKKGRSKSLNNRPCPSPGGQFGRGKISRRKDIPNSRGPMILSRRLSYRINSSTPGKSPVVATMLKFTPNNPNKVVVAKGRCHVKSSLEKIGQSSKQSRVGSKRKSV
jgi:hypothetical protein